MRDRSHIWARLISALLIASLLPFGSGIAAAENGVNATSTQQMTIVIFGSPGVNLNLYVHGIGKESGVSDETIEVPYEVTNTYHIFIFDASPQRVYHLKSTNSSGYAFSQDEFDGAEPGTYVVYLHDADEPTNLRFSGGIRDGRLVGRLYWTVDWHENETDKYSVIFYFTQFDGTTIGNPITPSYVYKNGDVRFTHVDVEIPNDAFYLQLYTKDGDVETPAGSKLRLSTDGMLPEWSSMRDKDPQLNMIKPEVSFIPAMNMSDVVAYIAEIEYGPHSTSSTWHAAAVLAETNDYTVEWPTSTHNWSNDEPLLKIFAVDHTGARTAVGKSVTVVDDMSELQSLYDYVGIRYKAFVLDGELLDGTVSETGILTGALWIVRPDYIDSYMHIYAYDLYFGDEEGNVISGLARFYREDEDGQEKILFIHEAEVPDGAAYIVIYAIGETAWPTDIAYSHDPLLVPLQYLPIHFGKLIKDGSGYVFQYVPKGKTVAWLYDNFNVYDYEAYAVMRNGYELSYDDPIRHNDVLRLVIHSGDDPIFITLHALSEHLRSKLNVQGDITLSHLAEYILIHRMDVTGDGKFDRDDVRVLLGEAVN